MKKLIFATTVAMLSIVVNAASCAWSAIGMDTLAPEAVLTDATYAFDTRSYTQQDFLDSWGVGGTAWKSYATAGTIDSGLAAGIIDGYENGDPVNLWTVFFDDKGNALLSDTYTDEIGSQGQDPNPFLDVSTASTKGIFIAEAGAFAANGAGWYTTPEPTSGLLLLLGLGVMALRRKRA